MGFIPFFGSIIPYYSVSLIKNQKFMFFSWFSHLKCLILCIRLSDLEFTKMFVFSERKKQFKFITFKIQKLARNPCSSKSVNSFRQSISQKFSLPNSSKINLSLDNKSVIENYWHKKFLLLIYHYHTFLLKEFMTLVCISKCLRQHISFTLIQTKEI